jgi:hypothetical protein
MFIADQFVPAGDIPWSYPFYCVLVDEWWRNAVDGVLPETVSFTRAFCAL